MDLSSLLALVLLVIGFQLCIDIYTLYIGSRRRQDARQNTEKFAALTARIFALERQIVELKTHAVELKTEDLKTREHHALETAKVPVETAPKPTALHPVAVEVRPVPTPVPPPPKPPVRPVVVTEPPPKPVVPVIPVAPPFAASTDVKVTILSEEAGKVPEGPVAPPPPPFVPAQKPVVAAASHTVTMNMPAVRPPATQASSTTVPLGNYSTPKRPLIDSQKLRRPGGVSFEEAIGANLLPKVGIAILVIGVALLTAANWEHIPAIIRIGMFYVLGGGLIAGGIQFERKENYNILGRVMIGGGWAISFFTTYAMQHVPAAQILHSSVLDMFLMLAVAGAMVWHTLKYDSQLVTGCAFLLGFVAVNISHETSVSMMAGVILAVGLTVIVIRRKWFELEVFGILASYLNHAYWLYQTFGRFGHQPFPGYTSSVLLVFSYWIIFRASYLARKVESKQQESVSTFAGLLSPILFLAVMKYQSFHHEWAFWGLLTMGVVEFTLGQLPVAHRRGTPFQVLSTLGATLMVAAVPTKFAGSHSLELLWLAGAEAFLLAGVFTRERLFRYLGGGISFLVAGYLLLCPGGLLSVATDVLTLHRHPDAQFAIIFLVVATVFYGNSHVVALRWKELFNHPIEIRGLRVLSFVASIFAVSAVYAWIPIASVAVVLALVVFVLSLTGKEFDIPDLIYQAHWIAAVAVSDVCITAVGLTTSWHNVPERFLTLAPVAALLYLSSWFVEWTESLHSEGASALYRWAGTGLIALLIGLQTQSQPWLTAVLWTALGLAVAVSGQQFQRDEFKWQAFVLALLSCGWAVFVNFQAAGTFHGVSERLLSVSLIAAGTYLLVRWAPVVSLRPVYSWAGTLLLGYLAFKEAPDPWIAVAWVTMAAALAAAARFWKDTALLWQTHLLSVMALGAAIVINLQPAHGGSRIQLITLLIAAALFYALNWLTDIAEILDDKRVSQAYAWAGSLLVSWLAWYQLSPTSISLAWGVFGLLLFEIGYNSRSSYLRAQGYVALAGSFVYIFIANFNTRSDVFSPPIIAVMLLVPIYFWIYARLHSRKMEASGKELRIRVEQLLACVGTATVAALVRFEMPPDSVAAGYAALVIALLVIAWRMCLPVFLYQSMVLLGMAAFRLSMNNLYNLHSSLTYDVTSTLAAIVLLAAAIPVAFRLRSAKIGAQNTNGPLGFVLRRPEQPLFFVAVALMSVFLFLRMQGMMITLSWCVEGAVVVVAGFFAKERSFVRTGLSLLIVCALKVFFDLLRVQDASVRYLAMMGVGAIMLVVSYLFAKNRDTLREYL